MSEDAPSKSKEKKALRDAERQKQRTNKKRKHTETETADGDGEVPVTTAEGSSVPQNVNDGIPTTDAPAVKAPKSKKRKLKEEEAPAGTVTADVSVPATAGAPVDSTAPKPKKRRKTKPDATNKAAPDVAEGTAQLSEPAKEPAKTRNDKFVVFIGNLPYNTTDASLQTHFQKLMPFTLRHRTDPKTKKSKGFAFIEFQAFDRMKTCLKLFHHSMFDPAELDKAATNTSSSDGRRILKGGRQINVELTAGGGGKNEGRMEKIKVKNVRLEEQRERRRELEAKEKAKEEAKGGPAKEQTKGGPAKKKQGGKRDEGQDASADAATGMHPSRLARLNV
ncbi:hypothetical protein LTR08_004008 [Meristemomyces frigidus]|nr:hypothetical protein LTR08_004008 [Meristemomyces frigidus]